MSNMASMLEYVFVQLLPSFCSPWSHWGSVCPSARYVSDFLIYLGNVYHIIQSAYVKNGGCTKEAMAASARGFWFGKGTCT